MKFKKENFLRLVKNYPSESESKRKLNPSHQIDMFEGSNGNSIIIIYFSDIDGALFSEAIQKTHPKCILDMRANPRFDISGYSRKIAFGEFDNLGTTYIDYVELVGASDKSKDHLIDAAEKIVEKIKQGPLVFIFGKKEQDGIYEEELMHKLPTGKEEWDLAVIP